MRWFLIVLAALTFAFAGAACGGDDEAASDTTEFTDTIDETTDETTTDEETTDGETTDGDTTDEDTDTSSSDGFASEECQELADASTELGNVVSGTSSADEIEEAQARFQELVDRAPDEIQEDLQVLADIYGEYAEVFADLDIEPGETPSPEQVQELVAALTAIDQQGVTEASTNLATWASENC